MLLSVFLCLSLCVYLVIRCPFKSVSTCLCICIPPSICLSACLSVSLSVKTSTFVNRSLYLPVCLSVYLSKCLHLPCVCLSMRCTCLAVSAWMAISIYPPISLSASYLCYCHYQRVKERPAMKCSWSAHDSALVSLEWLVHEAGTFVLSASTDKTAKLWDTEGHCVGVFGQVNSLYKILVTVYWRSYVTVIYVNRCTCI